MARLKLLFSDWRLYVSVGYVVLAVGLGLWMQRQTDQERDFLLAFVCESVALRLEQDGPTAEDFAARFGVIMREHHAHCSPPVKGLP
jgi:hypothetical protein